MDKKDLVDKNKKLQQISTQFYYFNNKLKKLQQELQQSIKFFQDCKQKYLKHRQIRTRMQLLSKVSNSTIKFLKQNRLYERMVDQNQL